MDITPSEEEKFRLATELNIDLCDLDHLTAAQAGKVGGLLAARRKALKGKKKED